MEVCMSSRTVAIYARVSTEHEAQLSALENQVQYYDDVLSKNPNWILYDKYIDEGITGTSTKKRKNFMRMMEDAKEGKFDLIITREVSRFARNTVDTLQETRKLKKMGVEVWFTEDNIWTMNDEDGELRLTIMATLAQNESKKTSLRVKAGQRVSFEKGVQYGNGNILGYDRVGKQLVINPEQAETVKMIFELHHEGNGVRRISYILEQRGRLTATGKKKWDCGVISRVLRNPFYCGTVVYRKQYVPDYLEQKKINNFGDVEKIVVEGSHEPIISKELFYDVQRVLDSRVLKDEQLRRRGKKVGGDTWTRLIKCCCGHSFNRRKWHKISKDEVQYAYQCYASIRTGTVATRTRKGLPIDGVCDVPMIPGWKFELMATEIFKLLFGDKEKILSIVYDLLEKNVNAESEKKDYNNIEEKIRKDVSKINEKLDRLLDLRLQDEITKEQYFEKKSQLEDKLYDLHKELDENISKQIKSIDSFGNKLEVLKNIIGEEYVFDADNVPLDIVEEFVDEIVVYKDKFIWKLGICRDGITCRVEGRVNNPKLSIEEIPPVCRQQHRLL